MKAIRVHGPREVRYEDVPDPQVGADDVLIKVKAAGLCGTDLEVYHGDMVYISQGLTSLPMIPGHEWSGEVIGWGHNVSEFKIGDRVSGECTLGCRSCDYCLKGYYNQCPNRRETGLLNKEGGFAELISFPRYFLHKCNALSFEESALTEPTGIAVYGVKSVGVNPHDYVAVLGPGPIGLFAVQVAKAYGAKGVLLTGTREERLSLGREIGADCTVNVKKDDLKMIAQEFTKGHMFNVVLEATGKPSVIEDMETLIRPRGRVGLMGLFSGQRGSFKLDKLVVENITIYGTLGSPAVWDESISLLESGKVKAKPLISHRMKLAEFEKGLKIMEQRKENVMKVILTP